jgi:hypothetical protein
MRKDEKKGLGDACEPKAPLFLVPVNVLVI